MTEKLSNWNRVDGVDLLRGLAIFFVLMNHIHMRLFLADVPYTDGFPEHWVSAWVWNGQHGVQIFFAVSGFLITSTSLRRWGSPSGVGIRAFYLLRVARIAPLLLLLLMLLSALHAAGVPDFIVSQKTGGLGRAVIAAMTFHVNLLEARRGYLPGNWDVLWSLSVEETFYLFFPLLCRLLGRGRGLEAVLAVFVCLGPFARTVFARGNEIWQEYSYLGGMDAIALGCLTALAVSRTTLRRGSLRAVCALGAALMLFVLGASNLVEASGLVHSGLDMSILAVGTCMVMAAAAQHRWSSPRFLFPLLRLGQRSYEVYLTHMFVVFACFDAFTRAGRPLPFVPVLFIAVIGGSALLGEAVARLYSEPMNERIRHSVRLPQRPMRMSPQ